MGTGNAAVTALLKMASMLFIKSDLFATKVYSIYIAGVYRLLSVRSCLICGILAWFENRAWHPPVDCKLKWTELLISQVPFEKKLNFSADWSATVAWNVLAHFRLAQSEGDAVSTADDKILLEQQRIYPETTIQPDNYSQTFFQLLGKPDKPFTCAVWFYRSVLKLQLKLLYFQ